MARPNRVKLSGEGCYHVIDRIAHREFLLRDERIKRRLVDLMHRAAAFSGVDVCTYVVMDNHLHLCVHVPEPAEVDERTVVERVGTLCGEARAVELRGELERLRAEGREDEAIRVLDRLRARMGDLSEFMKTFKQRVTQWYNRELGHEGTLWCGRFKSVLLEKDEAVRAVANYIHLNPVRARMVEAAAGYRWSGLGAAVRGDKRAIRDLSVIGMEGLSPARIGTGPFRNRHGGSVPGKNRHGGSVPGKWCGYASAGCSSSERADCRRHRVRARDGGKAEREVPRIADAAEDRHVPLCVARRPLRAKAGGMKGLSPWRHPHGVIKE